MRSIRILPLLCAAAFAAACATSGQTRDIRTGNQWLGARGRKSLLQETVCQAGADAVILLHPVERKSAAGGTVRDYEAQFISFAPGALEPAALPDLPPAEPGAIIVPRGMEWPEETLGEATRKWEPKQAAQPTK